MDEVSYTVERGTGAKKERQLPKTPDPEELRQQANPPGSHDMDRGCKNFEEEDSKSMYLKRSESVQSSKDSGVAEGADSNVKYIGMTPVEINDNLNDIHDTYDSLNSSNREPMNVSAGLASDMTDERQKTASLGFNPEKQFEETSRKEELSTHLKAPTSDFDPVIDEMTWKLGNLNIGPKHEGESISTVQSSVNNGNYAVAHTEKSYSKSMLAKQKGTNEDERPTADPQHENKHVISQGQDHQSVPKKASEMSHKKIPHGISHLRLDLELQKQFPDISVRVNSEYIEFKGPIEDIPKAEKHLDCLLSSIVIKKKSLRKPYIALLNQPKVERFMFDKLEKSDIRCHWKVKENELDCVYFFALKEEVIDTAFKILEGNIVTKLDVDSDHATELLLKFPGKCQKWAAGEEETHVSLMYTKDIDVEVISFLTAAAINKNKEEQAELEHKAEIEKKLKESHDMQAEELEQSEKAKEVSVGGAYRKQTGTGQSQRPSAVRSSTEIVKLTGDQIENNKAKQLESNVYVAENFVQADKGSESEKTYADDFIPMEHCLADFIMHQEEISEIKSTLNASIYNNCGKIIVTGDKKEQRLEALQQIKSLAEKSHFDFILKTDPIDKDSEEWHAIETEAHASNVSISIRSIEHRPLRDKEHYKVGETEICVGHGCISDIKTIDMIVVPVNRSFFPITPASELIFQKCGDRLFDETNKLVTKNMKSDKPPIGHIQISNVVGKLPCSSIAYIVVGESVADDVYIEKKLMDKLCYILKEDVRLRQQTSIALPLELSRTFPVLTSSKIIADAVKQAVTDRTTPLKNICLCAENVDNLELAKNVFREEFGQLDESDIVIVDIFDGTEDQQIHVKVEVITGSLVDQKVDALVCINNQWNLKDGAVSKEILDKGGEEIEQALKSYSKPTYGEVVAVTGGDLKCRHVLFGRLPSLTDSNFYVLENLKLFLKNCFKTAKTSKCHSLAFPVLGTGEMKYPVSMVAKEMFRAAHFYAAQNGVDRVKIVLLKDDPNLKVFSELNIRFQAMQKDLVEEEDSWKYLDVKIGDCQTKITVVQGTDQEAFASNIIVKTMQLQQGQKAYEVRREDPNPHVLNTDYFILCFRPSPTDYDFKLCLGDVLTKLEKTRYVFVTLDFSQGLGGSYNYIKLTIEALKLKSYSLKAVEKLTIVSDERMFQELLREHSGTQTEATNLTLAGKVTGAISNLSLWSKQVVNVTVKEHKTKPYGGAQTSWLTVLCAMDPQKLQAIRQKIDSYCKKSVGSSVDDKMSNLEFQTMSLKENEEKRKDTARASTSGTRKVLAEDARGSTDLTDTGDSTDLNETGESADLTESGESTQQDGEDSGDEVFGMVEAVLPFDCRAGQQLADLKNSLSGVGTNSVKVGSHGAKTSLKFDFYERHNMQNALLKLKDKGLFSEKEKEFVIEDVDDNLYQLLLLYMKESKGGTQIKMENLSREENKVHVNDEVEIFDVLKTKIQALRSWNTEIVCFDDKDHSKAVDVVRKLKAEDLNVIVKLSDNEIHINGASEHTGPAKHKVSIELGLIKPTGRRRRQFNEEYSSLPLQKSLEPVVTVPAPFVDTGSNSLEKLYQTSEGITVKVYKGSITSLPVDCIVNAANERLGHGAGVAAAISRAAGPHFQQESDNQVQIHGPVKVTKCIKTSAGSLNYKCVIHAVGPRFSQYTSSTDDANDLKSTVMNALIMAEEEGMISVALPSISAGMFDGKPDLCADMYAWGVQDFSRSNQGRHSLKEIHFVDIQNSLVKTIQSKFDIAFTLMNLDSSSKFVTNDSKGNLGETVKTNAGKTRGARTGASNRDAAETEEDAKYDKHHSYIHSHEGSSYNSMYEFGGNGSLTKPHASSFRVADTEMRKETSPKRYPGQDFTGNTTPSIETGNQREVYVRAKDDLLTVTVKNKPTEMPSKPKTYAQATSTGNSGGELPKSPVKRDAGPSKTFDDSLQFTFPRKSGIEVSVQQADISLLNVDVVVCPESVSCRGDGSIARSIQSVLNNKTIWDDAQRRKPQALSAFKSPVRPGMPYKHVILVFSPRWTHATTKNKIETGIRKCIQNIFDQLKRTDIRSIALPVLGIGDDTTPYQWCCEIMCDEISNAILTHSTQLTDIIITSTYKKTILDLKDILTKELIGSSEQAGSHKTTHDTKRKKLCKACSKEMDATVPTVNTCQHCLHKSPKKQIEALPTRSFEPRGVHPYCIMSQEIVKYKLSGYDCDTIRITYEFPSGMQRAGDPYPGALYQGCKKLAYLPNNEGGLMVFHLFKKALAMNKVSRVNKYSLVQWTGEVEHKTSLKTGDRYGYPDSDYFARVMKRLSYLERESTV